MYRQFEIVYILMNKTSVTAPELADHFGVSLRTIYRDIDTLCFAGIPVFTQQGKGGGISLLPEFTLNKSIFSAQEQQEILSALKGLASVKAIDTDKTLSKLSALFNRQAASWLEIDFSDWSNNQSRLFQSLKTAILEKRIVEFTYYNSRGEKTLRRIEPVLLWFKSKTWYVVGWCLEKQDVRIFKLTRIKKLHLTDTCFPARDLQALFDEMEAEEIDPAAAAAAITFTLKIASEMAYRVYDDFDDTTLEKQSDGSFIVQICELPSNYIVSLILSYGEYIEVLSPDHIRQTIKEKAQKILQKY